MQEKSVFQCHSVWGGFALADAERPINALIMDNPTPEVIDEGMREFLTYTRAPYKQRKSILRYAWPIWLL